MRSSEVTWLGLVILTYLNQSKQDGVPLSGGGGGVVVVAVVAVVVVVDTLP